MAKKSSNMIGGWAFLIGVVLALIFSFIQAQAWVSITLVVLGIIIGLLNIADRETQAFLTSGVVLVIVAALGGNTLSIIPYLSNLLDALLLIFVPATIVVAIKNVFALARD